MSSGLHGIAVYNPSLSSDEELRNYFVARQTVLHRIMDDINREQQPTPPQHQLILGQRGMGKTTLLRRIAIATGEDPTLNQEWLPLTFPEEQYNIASPRDFWLNCLDALCDALERTGRLEETDRLDAVIKNKNADKADGQQLLQTLMETSRHIGRKLGGVLP